MKRIPPLSTLKDSANRRNKRSCRDEDQKEETEAERQLKCLLHQQTQKKITLIDQFSRHRSFRSSIKYTPLTAEIRGQLNVNEFKDKAEAKDQIDGLQQSGLTDQEIKLKLHIDGIRTNFPNKNVEPSAMESRIKELETKLKDRDERIDKTSQSRGVKYLTRSEMEIERSLKPNSEQNKILARLVAPAKSWDHPHPDDPMNHLKNIESEFMQKVNRNNKRKKKKVLVPGEMPDNSPIPAIFPQPYLPQWKDVSPVPIEEILNGRLDVPQIKSLPRFANYEPGIPSKTLYLKNLSRRVGELDLFPLFRNFLTSVDSPDIDLRLMRGKMKGQAFVTFQDVETAAKAFRLINGYNLLGNPIIIQYGKRKS